MIVSNGATAATLYVSPVGSDSNPGTRAKPLATPGGARDLLRQKGRGHGRMTVYFRGGVYYLPETLAFTHEDSGTKEAPVTYASAPGEKAVLSGGRKLQLSWEPYRDGIMRAKTPEDLTAIDQLFVGGLCQPMARYPNFDAGQRIMNGFAADAFSPERAARWADPAGGYIHAMHREHWGGYHYRITGKKPDHTVTYEGGWQNNRQMGMHPDHRYVENVFEELDVPGEWFHDARTSTLYYYPAPGIDLETAPVEVVRLRHLVEFNGSREEPVRYLTLRGFTFRHAARTFMETKEPLLRSDWTIYRGGTVVFNGAEDCILADCEFDQVGGNTVFVNNYNRRITVRGSLISNSGGSGVVFVGDPEAVRNPLFEYNERNAYADLDRSPGPKSDNYPADCRVEDCLITRTGRVEKQSAGVQISMARRITVRHCSIYDVPRAGINISEGTWGGHLIEHCDVFDAVRETGDHGSFNSWGRDRYWGLEGAPPGELPDLALLDAVAPTIIRNSRWRCDHGWDIDLDDGSSRYEIYNNLMLRGGLKLREGFHRKAYNNVIVDNSLHPHVWYPDSGDVFTRNIVMGAYRPAIMPEEGRWGEKIDLNLFTREDDRAAFAKNGCDTHSLAGDPRFIDPERGDFRVREDSPARKLGFRNFPMDRFGVRKPALKAIARTPEISTVLIKGDTPADGERFRWKGATLRNLSGDEFSAFGVAADAGGVLLEDVPLDSEVAGAGLQKHDLIRGVNGESVKTVAELRRRLHALPDGEPVVLTLRRDQRDRTLRL